MYNKLTSEQRYEIYLGIKRKWSISRISREIEVSASTVLREIRRNSNTNGEYVWRTAQRKAEARKHGLEGNHRKPAELWWRIELERLKCGRKAVPTAKVVARLLFPYMEFVHTITTDNGCEFAAHLEITRMLSRGGRERGKVYFADSYCSWQKGAIENANKLIRKYIPKKANFDDFSDSKIMKIQKKINRRPREKINFDSPKDRFFKHFY